MSVIIRRPWTTQPQVATGIDWSNPLTRGLHWAFGVSPGGKSLYDPVRLGFAAFHQNAGTFAQSWVPHPGAKGYAVVSSDSGVGSDITIQIGNATGSGCPLNAPTGTTGRSCTVQWGINLAATPSDYAVIYDSSAAAYQLLIRLTTAAKVQVVWPGQYILLESSGAIPVGIDTVVTVVVAPNYVAIYFNGILDSSTGAGGDPNWAIGQSYIFGLGAAGLNGTKWWAPTAWSRALLPSEIASGAANPWQLFAPLPRRIWAPSAGGAATVAGSIAATLLDVGVGASKSGAAASIAGSLSDSGVGASSVSAAGSIAGSLAVSGVGRGVTSAVGSISATAAVNGVGASSVSAAAEVDGVLVVGGVGASLGITSAVGSISASATVQGVGASTSSAVVSSSSVLAVDGVGASLGVTTAVGSISAAAAVDGVGATQASAVATSASVLSMAGVGSTGGVLVAADGAISASLVVSGLSASTVVAAGDIVASLSMADYVPTVSMRPEGRRKKRKTNQDDIDIMELAAIMAPVLCGNATCL